MCLYVSYHFYPTLLKLIWCSEWLTNKDDCSVSWLFKLFYSQDRNTGTQVHHPPPTNLSYGLKGLLLDPRPYIKCDKLHPISGIWFRDIMKWHGNKVWSKLWLEHKYWWYNLSVKSITKQSFEFPQLNDWCDNKPLS